MYSKDRQVPVRQIDEEMGVGSQEMRIPMIVGNDSDKFRHFWVRS